ncbi:MAG: NUDIX domain-containing protein [Bacillota bacterium]|nr:NUDIX domain-containing protein [Bacillota bacterium]
MRQTEQKIAMVHSLKYDYYKFPGGGISCGESHLDALLREVAKETGLIVIPKSVKEYGQSLLIKDGKF